ncbi:sterol 3beta-glucosyltransferase [Lentzea albidocapillata subsp. violacea]|uniref:Sterol 3beta-glucosyltransferase n=1 Tax=Lentzea albidocapillata subsp. violacea TaxID=128104 RepID=A0A1G9F861_9PSEU|nr:glycosyltransferase [Lentzea albidocapillata]SDK84572.1 sterol 3beta-glucosyltransferase [Lentzea albidocapillata subsp. violacea]
MKVLLVTHGTRGDVQPLLALAVALRKAGHEALLAAPESFASSALTQDVEFAPLDNGPNRLLEDPLMAEAIEGGYRGLRGKITALSAIRRIKPLMADVLRDAGAVARSSGADLVVHTPSVPAQHAAEMLGVPAVLAALQPGWVPTSEFPCPMVPLPRLPRFLNRATYLTVWATLRAYSGIVNTWRTNDLGLPRGQGPRQAHVLQAFSALVTPVDPAWPDSVRTIGFWYLPREANWEPDATLQEFLDAGPAPVYIGFGSMAGRDAQRTGDIVAEAARAAGVRAIVATGWGGLAARSSDDLLVIDQVPHDWLFGQVRAVVHHGGGGTTAAALAAGVPQVVCPFVADQPHWAQRMHAVGVAPQPVPYRKLAVDTLSGAITQALALRKRAGEVGEQIRAENGVNATVRELERIHNGRG